MGAIVAEESKNSDKMTGGAGREEKILVLVRLRPLNDKEVSKNEVADWECINDSTILYRNSLQERSGLPTVYSFGDCPSKQVYEEGTKEIALSVVSGINSSIFAYGQTSSGKTYTMNAITEYTVADIYDYMQRHEERAFALKFSAMEIYNENVRDLLSSDNTPLRLMDDPETIESSAREFIGKGNSSTLSASVFFIDLAGSERAAQAMSAGTRLKEGCHINRSLLTLGNVIRKLSMALMDFFLPACHSDTPKGRQGHINYRDSKLTRILQPCLGGNARTTIICTLSPARSHVEQSRNTLLFASCAKQVTTNAQVNVVMSDKALVKHLQKELARLESELRSPAPTSSSCNCSVTIRKKDLQLEKMEKEIRELTKQRDLAQSRVEDLLQIIGNDQSSNKQQRHKPHSKWKVPNKWEDEGSISDSSVNGHHRVDGVQDEDGESYIEDPSSRALEHEDYTSEMGDDQCREVRCIEMEGSEASTTFGNGHGSNGRSSHQNGYLYGSLEQRIQEVQRSIDSLVSPQPENPSVWDDSADASSSRSMNFSKVRGSKGSYSNGQSYPSSKEEYSERTPPSDVEMDYSGRPGEFKRFAVLDYGGNSEKLSRNGSQSSVGTEVVDDVRSLSGNNVADEEITSVQTFVAGLKDAKLQYEKQLGDGQGPPELRKSLRDVGLDPMIDGEDSEDTTLDWNLQFEKLQKAIVELWKICNVSLVHRTYFFLLFKGDPTDSIYLEVELRRLTFLKDTLSHVNRSVDGGHALKLISSEKALRKERETLSKLINRRFSSEERKRLYTKWGIKPDSKRRRAQLVSRLWTETEDMDHIVESAAIIAKLVKFSEQGRAFKGMFGLSFSPPILRRRSYGWMNSKTSLV
uniref:Kinesin-like protein n=1 Tax=Chenopodium quinoa TaxID=63459 RepID=A0A803LPF0_CHEQI